MVCRVAQDGGFPVNEALFDHVHGELEGGHGSAFAVACLEHEELAVLDGELEVLNVLEVFFEDAAHFFQFGIRFWKVFFELGDWFGCANAGYHVFALSVDEELAVELFFAVGWVAGEGDAGAGVIACVAKDHRLDVDCGAPFCGDVVFAAIDDCAVVHPGAKDGADGALELFPWVGGEALACAFFDQSLEPADQLLLVFCGEVAVCDVVSVAFVLEFVDD